MKTAKQIWDAIDKGKTVCWMSEIYEVHSVESNGSEYAKPTERGDKALRCSCVENYFGSYLSPKEFKQCFVVNKKPTLKGE